MDVMQSFTVKNLVDGAGETGSCIAQLHLARHFAETNNIVYNVVRDSRTGPGGYTTRILRSLRNSASRVDIRFLAGSRGCKNENNDSLIVLVGHKRRTFLFTNDAESEKRSNLSVGDYPIASRIWRRFATRYRRLQGGSSRFEQWSYEAPSSGDDAKDLRGIGGPPQSART